jgi:hypothetical protein
MRPIVSNRRIEWIVAFTFPFKVYTSVHRFIGRNTGSRAHDSRDMNESWFRGIMGECLTRKFICDFSHQYTFNSTYCRIQIPFGEVCVFHNQG